MPSECQFKKVWVTGAAGLIGYAVVDVASREVPGIEVIPLTRKTVDLTGFDAVRERFRSDRPDLVVHCAALSRSTDCEAKPELARCVNVDAVGVLAELTANCRLVFLSTDLVFDGRHGNYTETAPHGPLGVYAETKVAAEQVVLSFPNHIVIRTSLNGGDSPKGERGFNEQLRLAWAAGQIPRLFVDEFRSPIASSVTARAIWELALEAAPGIYHVAGAERLSRLQIGQLVAARWPSLNPRIEPASLRAYRGAPRAPDTSLNCTKAQAVLSFALPGFTEWLAGQPPGSF